MLIYQNNKYISLFKNIPVKVKSQFITELNNNVSEQVKPHTILVDSYMLQKSLGSAQFNIEAAGFVSVLDNYINVDEKFFVN